MPVPTLFLSRMLFSDASVDSNSCSLYQIGVFQLQMTQNRPTLVSKEEEIIVL